MSVVWSKKMSAAPAHFGAVLQLRAQPGRRDDLVTLLGNYVNTLDDGEPGTTLLAVALDPGDEAAVWMWEEFADADAVGAHFSHDFFRALQLELADLLVEAPAVRPLTPAIRHVRSGVTAE
ncbi:MAG: antibiotic biosynthesis monooxygenase [bacterium]